MARRPIDPEYGFRKLVYRQGNVLDEGDVEQFVAGADVVVHLAFIILGTHDETRKINLKGSQQRVRGGGRVRGQAARVRVLGGGLRLLPGQPPAADRGRPAPRHRQLLLLGPEGRARAAARRPRPRRRHRHLHLPALHRGRARRLAHDRQHPLRAHLRAAARRRAAAVRHRAAPASRSSPTPASATSSSTTTTSPPRSAPAIQGKGEPGIYNLAGEGELTLPDLASEMGYYTIPVPELAIDATAELTARLPFMPPEADVAPGLPRAHDHGHEQGAQAAGLAAQAHRPRRPAHDGAGVAGRAPRLVARLAEQHAEHLGVGIATSGRRGRA